MPSPLKSEASRINGAKSRGPITAAGLAKSSQNAVKHGGSSTRGLLLASESPEEYQALHDSYLATHKPDGAAETALVDQMAAARWRILRFDTIETDLLDDEMTRQDSLARAFRALADESKALGLAGRYQSRQHRIHDRAYKTLRELQQTRLSQEPEQPHKMEVSWITPEQRIAREALDRAAGYARRYTENGYYSEPTTELPNLDGEAAVPSTEAIDTPEELPNGPTVAATKEVSPPMPKAIAIPKPILVQCEPQTQALMPCGHGANRTTI